jgi:uncharacterized protein (TIGR02300 family)
MSGQISSPEAIVMSTKAERGTKRTCQNPECGCRFYDLNRDPIACPICSTVYQPAMAMAGGMAGVEEKAARKPVKKPVYAPAVKPEEPAEAEGEERLAAIEGAEEPAAGEEDETFLEEEEEEGPDVSGILGGPVAETDEQT